LTKFGLPPVGLVQKYNAITITKGESVADR